jgi:anti-sigma B factor antagonist
MEVQFADVSGVTKAILEGRLDTANVNIVETRFIAGIVPRQQHAVVDLSKVSFIASLGIRMLLSTARALGSNGAKFAMFGATPVVLEVFEATALSEIIPLAVTEDEAIALVTG